MPGLPTGAQLGALLAGLGDPARSSVSAEMVRSGGRGRAARSRPRARRRPSPAQVTPAPTATAAPQRAGHDQRPRSTRRTMSRARDPGTCHLPETPSANTFVRHFLTYRWSSHQSARLRCCWPLGSHVRGCRPEWSVSQSGSLPLGGGQAWVVVRCAADLDLLSSAARLIALMSAGLTPSVAAAPTCIYIVQGLPSRTVSVTVDGETLVDCAGWRQGGGTFPGQAAVPGP